MRQKGRVRNSELYSRMCQLYGEVQILNAGSDREQYAVNCPYCGDTRSRFHVRYDFGTRPDEPTDDGRYPLRLTGCQCFNETQCHRVEGVRWDFYLKLIANFGSLRGNISAATVQTSRELEEVDWPGECTPVGCLREGHVACKYLRDRGFDPVFLSEQFGVSYCHVSQYRFAEGRIIFPVYAANKLVGWSARFIPDRFSEKEAKEMHIPKYYNMPGMLRDKLLYNFDAAVSYPTVVIVEGQLDVISTGPYAVACLGDRVSSFMCGQLVKAMSQKYHGDEGVIVIMLDPDRPTIKRKEKESEAKYTERLHKANNVPHPIERLASDLSTHPRVLPVYLPKGVDPGSCDTKWLQNYMQQRAKKAGLKLLFKKKGENYYVRKFREAAVVASGHEGPAVARKGLLAKVR